MKNVISLDAEIGNKLPQDHNFKIDIVSKKLADFNERFGRDVMLFYSINGIEFTPLEEYDEYAVWFCEGITELLTFASSPTCNNVEELDYYLQRRKRNKLFVLC